MSSQNLSVILGQVFLSCTSTKLGLIMCLAQGHNAETPVKLNSVALRSPVKHSTTEPLRSLYTVCKNEKDLETKIYIFFFK